MKKRATGDRVTNLATPFVVFAIVAVATVAPALAQLGPAKSTEIQRTEAGAAAQQTIDKLDDERDKMLQEYRAVLQQLQSLKDYNAQMRNLITDQEKEMVSIREQIERVTGIERDIVPLMSEMLSSLEQFVALDIPFLKGERTRRIQTLKAMMNDSDVTNAEKYRRILEAYQIENDYGRTIEAYDGKLGDGEDAKTVTFLKVGRIAYLYQTLDGSDTYAWDTAAGDWKKLKGEYNSHVTIAIRMAREQVPPGLIYVPLKAPIAAETVAQ